MPPAARLYSRWLWQMQAGKSPMSHSAQQAAVLLGKNADCEGCPFPFSISFNRKNRPFSSALGAERPFFQRMWWIDQKTALAEF